MLVVLCGLAGESEGGRFWDWISCFWQFEEDCWEPVVVYPFICKGGPACDDVLARGRLAVIFGVARNNRLVALTLSRYINK